MTPVFVELTLKKWLEAKSILTNAGIPGEALRLLLLQELPYIMTIIKNKDKEEKDDK